MLVLLFNEKLFKFPDDDENSPQAPISMVTSAVKTTQNDRCNGLTRSGGQTIGALLLGSFHSCFASNKILFLTENVFKRNNFNLGSVGLISSVSSTIQFPYIYMIIFSRI